MRETHSSVLIGAAVFLMLASGASAQGTEGQPDVESGFSRTVRITGHVEADHIAYFEPGETDRRAGRNEMLAQIDGLMPLGRTFRVFGSVELRTDFENHTRDRLHVDELYGEVVHGRFDLRVGKQIIAWGKTDLVNPTDHLSPRDFTDPLESDEERIGVLAVRPRVQWGSLQWEGAIVPVFTGSIMPGRRSRWSPPLPPRAQNPFQPEQVMRLEYELLPPREPATTLENMQYATRLSGSVRGWDLSASYFDGWDDVPRFDTQVSISHPGTSTVRITPEHLRKRVVGGDVATVVGPFTVRAEAAHIRPHPRQGPQYFQYVLGAERTFGDMMASGGTFVLVQWIQSVLPGELDAGPLEFDYLFRKATMARLQHNVTVAFQFGMEGLYEWERGGYYLQPVASYRFGGRMRVEGLVDLLGGRQDEFFGLFGDNTRFQSRLRYSF
jgi:hypothetical protein